MLLHYSDLDQLNKDYQVLRRFYDEATIQLVDSDSPDMLSLRVVLSPLSPLNTFKEVFRPDPIKEIFEQCGVVDTHTGTKESIIDTFVRATQKILANPFNPFGFSRGPQSVGRRTFLVEELPEGAIPVYDRDPIVQGGFGIPDWVKSGVYMRSQITGKIAFVENVRRNLFEILVFWRDPSGVSHKWSTQEGFFHDDWQHWTEPESFWSRL